MAQREQRVTPLEIFFDLVFVYAITQVTLLMSDDPTWSGVGLAPGSGDAVREHTAVAGRGAAARLGRRSAAPASLGGNLTRVEGFSTDRPHERRVSDL